MPSASFKKYEKSRIFQGIQYYYARFNEKTEDGITYAVEAEINHKPTSSDYIELANQWLENNRKWKLIGSSGYAKCDVIKHFIINGTSGWIDSDTRVSLAKTVKDKRSVGRTDITIYIDGIGYTMSLDQADNFLSSIEVYASDCYEVTEQHKQSITNITTIDDMNAYDYTSNYPEVLNFTV